MQHALHQRPNAQPEQQPSDRKRGESDDQRAGTEPRQAERFDSLESRGHPAHDEVEHRGQERYATAANSNSPVKKWMPTKAGYFRRIDGEDQRREEGAAAIVVSTS